MRFDVFEIKRKRGSCLREFYEDGAWSFTYSEKNREITLPLYTTEELGAETVLNLYNGHSECELWGSGRDILAEEILRNGEPELTEIRKLLPQFKAGEYAFLGGFASWSGIMVDRKTGNIYPQSTATDRKPTALFAPVTIDTTVCDSMPRQFLAGGNLPIMLSVHSDEKRAVEFMYFVEPGDPDRDPVLWIRIKKYEIANPGNFSLEYKIAAKSRHVHIRTMDSGTFMTALIDTVSCWTEFAGRGAEFDIPEKLLEKVVSGTMIACATTFSGDHAHYGHNVYGQEIHDNFPPNYIWSITACCVLGYTDRAKRIFRHLLAYSLNDEGRFFYRQGAKELFGASAQEYGWLLFIADKYQKQLGADDWSEEEWQKLEGMGRIIVDNCTTCHEFGNRLLVYMCAEADTNTRVHAYVHNNFWGIRGLRALSGLLKAGGRGKNSIEFEETAEILFRNITELIGEHSIEDEVYGSLPPFRLGYTAKPLNLSICKASSQNVTEEAFEKYNQRSDVRSRENEGQDLTENIYANYRYYPELLGAMMLKPHQAEAVVRLREDVGGEFMGMTRFSGWVDDWPVLSYARYLLESGKTDKYLLLLYAHTCHHGNPDLMCYFEQVSPTAVIADDCIPSLLTSPIMTGWMFAYEPMNSPLLLLTAGVPKSWFDKGFSVKNLGWSGGKVSIKLAGNTFTADFSEQTKTEAVIVWRSREQITMDDIISGMEYAEKCEGNRITLKKGITKAEITVVERE